MTSVSATNTLNKRHVLITGSSGYVGQHLIASFLLGGAGDPSCVRDVVDDVSRSTSSEEVTIGEIHKVEEVVQYELFCAYNSLSTFEKDLEALLEQHQRQRELRLPTSRPPRANIHLIPNIDFSQPNYLDVIKQAIVRASTHVNQPPPLDAIIHLAALSSPGVCEENASLAYQVNCPTELLKLNAPIIYLSTDQVYEGTKQYYEEDADETVPVNVYGRSKLAFERVLLREGGDDGQNRPLLAEREVESDIYCKRHLQDITVDRMIPSAHPNSVVLRSSLILGPPPPLANGCKKGSYPSFLQFIESRLRSSTPTEYFVNEFRSVVHIYDVIKAVRHFLENGITTTSSNRESTTVKVYNLGGSARVSRYDIAIEVASQLNVDSSSAIPVNRHIGEESGGVPSPPDISMNVDKITRELNSSPKGLREIVEATFSRGS